MKFSLEKNKYNSSYRFFLKNWSVFFFITREEGKSADLGEIDKKGQSLVEKEMVELVMKKVISFTSLHDFRSFTLRTFPFANFETITLQFQLLGNEY